MISQVDVLQAVKAIRPYLPELLELAEANRLAQRLEHAIATTHNTSAQQRDILTLLSEAESTREWTRLFIEEGKPAAEILKLLRTYHPLPGKSGAIASPRYRCPVASCNQTWYRRDVSAEIPKCPIHGVNMIRDSKFQESQSQQG